MEAGIRFLKGYRSVVQLDEKDIDHLLLLICCRLATSVTIGLDAYKRQPENKVCILNSDKMINFENSIFWYMCDLLGILWSIYGKSRLG